MVRTWGWKARQNVMSKCNIYTYKSLKVILHTKKRKEKRRIYIYIQIFAIHNNFLPDKNIPFLLFYEEIYVSFVV